LGTAKLQFLDWDFIPERVLIRWAVRQVEAGAETKPLILLAGLLETELWQAQDLFRAVLAERDVDIAADDLLRPYLTGYLIWNSDLVYRRLPRDAELCLYLLRCLCRSIINKEVNLFVACETISLAVEGGCRSWDDKVDRPDGLDDLLDAYWEVDWNPRADVEAAHKRIMTAARALAGNAESGIP